MYDRKCCRCGMCCLSEVCPAGMVWFAIPPSEKKTKRCPGLKFKDGQASCQIAVQWPELMQSLGMGAGCCIKARVLLRGETVAFETLPDDVKLELAERVRNKMIKHI